MKSHKKSQGGFTLIEFAAVMFLIVLGTVFALGRIGSSNQTSNVAAEANNLQQVAQKAAARYSSRPSYAGLTTAQMLSIGAFPTQMVAADGVTVTNVWRGAVSIAAGAGNTSMDITYAAVPTAACNELVANISGFKEVTVGGTKLFNGATIPDLTAAQTACATASTVSMVFNHL